MAITCQELIQNLGDLPPLPQVASQVLKLATNPDSTMDDLQKVISTDQALASQVLKISNSAMFGMVREVRTLSQAIMTLGFSTIKSVVIAASAKHLYNRGNTGLQERLLWEHALTTALASRAYARSLRSPRMEEAFLGGLLHDIGKSVMGLKYPERYGALTRAFYNEPTDVSYQDQELDLFGFDHTMVGEAVVRSWNLPPGLESCVRHHHDPLHAPVNDQPLAALVALGNRLAHDLKPWPGRPIQTGHESLGQAMRIHKLTEATLEGHRQPVLEALEADKQLIADL
jgi:putative nucleotidyltransferase with HDIG domain